MATAHASQLLPAVIGPHAPARQAGGRSRDCLHLVLEPVPGSSTLAAAAAAALNALPGAARPALRLVNPDLAADLRRIRAERFHDVYAQLSLRRRRAQIAARRALGGGE